MRRQPFEGFGGARAADRLIADLLIAFACASSCHDAYNYYSPPPPSDHHSCAMLALQLVTNRSPKAAHAAAVAANGRVYLHGGIHVKDSDNPSSALWRFDPNTDSWTLLNADGPRLSHHVAFVQDDRFLNFVGGWDGSARTSSVHTFDSKHETWLPMAPASGFPVGGGLSSHSVTPMTGEGALVIGRLGGLRTQRRTSAVLSLTGDHRRGFRFKVHEIPVASRSGHTAVAVNATRALVIGGRSDPHNAISIEELKLPFGRFDTTLNAHTCNLLGTIKNTTELTGRQRIAGRRYHVAVADACGRVLMHGGEGYEHLLPNTAEMRADLAVWQASPKRDGGGVWFDAPLRSTTVSSPSLLARSPKLSAHCGLAAGGGVLLFGGFKEGWRASKATFLLRPVEE
uniref:Uncharacterized protein n=1 Tax=Plectus sambesii TaxID=2011161 RepID=A0A914UZX4_9BILA